MGINNEQRQRSIGVLLATFGVGLTIVAARIAGGLWAFVFRDIGIAVGMAMVAIGFVIADNRSRQPLTPIRAWAVPLGVALGVGMMVVLQTHYSNGVGLEDAFWSPEKGFLLAASIGVPLGSAIKHNQRRHLLRACFGAVGILVISGWLTTIPVAVLSQPFWIGFVGVPGLMAVLLGYALTPALPSEHA